MLSSEDAMKMRVCHKLRRLTVSVFASVLLSTFLTSRSYSADSEAVAHFKDLLVRRPVIARLVFEKEVMLEGIPEGAKKQTFFARWQPGAYYLEVITDTNTIDTSDRNNIYVGQWPNEMWELHAGNLTTSDASLDQDLHKSPVSGTVMVAGLTIDLVASLGLIQVQLDSLSWTNNTLFGRMEDGQAFTGILTIKDDVPVELALRLPQLSTPFALISYQYKSNFLDGSFPFQFSRKRSTQYGRYTDQFKVTLLEFQTSSVPLDISAFNPRNFLDTDKAGIFVYSNGATYAEQRFSSGKFERVLTTEEANKSLRKPIGFKLIALVSLTLASIFALILLARKARTKQE